MQHKTKQKQKSHQLHTLQNRAQVHDSLRLPYERDLTIGPNGNDVVCDDPLFKNCAKRRVSERIPGLPPTAGRYNRARGFQTAGMFIYLCRYIIYIYTNLCWRCKSTATNVRTLGALANFGGVRFISSFATCHFRSCALGRTAAPSVSRSRRPQKPSGLTAGLSRPKRQATVVEPCGTTAGRPGSLATATCFGSRGLASRDPARLAQVEAVDTTKAA